MISEAHLNPNTLTIVSSSEPNFKIKHVNKCCTDCAVLGLRGIAPRLKDGIIHIVHDCHASYIIHLSELLFPVNRLVSAYGSYHTPLPCIVMEYNYYKLIISSP